jgi:peptidyl-prolyl cis-trans isomerase SurA
MIKYFLLALLTLSIHAKTIDGVAVLVKEEPITMYDIRTQMRESGLSAQKAADLLIRKKLEEIEAEERHISVGKEEVLKELRTMAEQNKMSLIQLYEAIQSSRGLSEKELKAKIREKLLNQKLYSAIAFSHMEEPTPEEEEEYYQLHADEFTHPERFEVTVYSASSKAKLQEKVDNPMFYSPEIRSENAVFEYASINPRLAELLNKTPLNSFTPIIPSPEGGFMSFYLKEKSQATAQPLDAIRPQIANAIMAEKREQVLTDYFSRLRLSAGIKIIRLPE